MFQEQILLLQQRLQKHADAKTKAWWENYVKESAPFLGVKMALVRSEVHQWHQEYVEGELTLPEQLNLALILFEGAYTEEKLAGTLYLQEILLPAGALDCPRDVVRFASLFDEGLIYDWNICDWFCIKVLGPLIEESGPDCADRIAEWRKSENLWRARASLVAFVPLAGDSAYYPAVKASCAVLIGRPERFAKTAVGWILREISRFDEDFVREVLNANIQHFSSESLKNATKYFGKEEQEQYRQLGNAGSEPGRPGQESAMG
ncbi:MAG: DNA alkylation repair protein [Chloroflexota bacterium]|nr:MAG: DNA alkylation repair protein [Chloroflexota bacterium]